MSEKFDLLSCSCDEITKYLTDAGEPKYRGAQVFKWLHEGAGFDEMTNLPKSLREYLHENAELRTPVIAKRQLSSDGTVKYLLTLHDGETIESVFMRYKHGNTLCISSQAGCRMGCRFCASTKNGLARSLSPSELLGQVLCAQADTKERVSNIVMMGIGEPLDNYESTVKFLRIVSEAGGLNIGLRHISVSTCGIVSNILRLAAENLPITLSVSLHASLDEVRDELMPINRKYNISSLMSACREYYKMTKRRISFEYTLIKDKNDTAEHAYALASLLVSSLRGMPLHVNLIPVNTVAESGYVKSTRQSVQSFTEILEKRGITATLRRHLGDDIDASCGQLRNKSCFENTIS